MRRLPLLTLLVAALVTVGSISACGDDEAPPTSSTPSPTTPTTDGSTTATSTTFAAPRAYTKNTTRLDAADPTGVAALTALTMYPSTARDLRPDAVTFAGADDWRSILLASSFAAKPLGFPLLLMDGRNLPPVSAAALAQLQPAGAPSMNKAQACASASPTGPRTICARATSPPPPRLAWRAPPTASCRTCAAAPPTA